MGFEKPLTGAQRVAKRRAALRAQGLKPKTIWVPDRNSDAFKEQARRDCERAWELVPEEEQAMAFVEAMTDELLRDHPY
jgi:Protein  of unknown function (DUF3018)